MVGSFPADLTSPKAPDSLSWDVGYLPLFLVKTVVPGADYGTSASSPMLLANVVTCRALPLPAVEMCYERAPVVSEACSLL